MLKKWEELPEFMKTDEVKKYYEILSKKKPQLVLKRVFDIVMSLLMLILLAPIMLILALLIKLDSEGSVFYKQERITQYGKTFKIFKFRTMVQNADKIGTLVTVDNDSRVTKVGSYIRKIRLDEFPQLFNVLKGEMSFVGTRPEVKKYVDEYTDEMYATLLLPAGITSSASIKFKNEDELLSGADDIDNKYVLDVLPLKMKFNLEDIENFSFFNDIKVMIGTVLGVLEKDSKSEEKVTEEEKIKLQV